MAVSIANRLSHPLLLVLLADGRLHSGEWLASQLDMSRAAVWKGVQRLRGMGLDVVAQPRRGYRLSEPVELLDAQRIGAQIGPERSRLLRKLELLFEVDSTNTRLLGNAAPPRGQRGCSFERDTARGPRAPGAPLDCTVRQRGRLVGGLDLRRWRTYFAGLELGRRRGRGAGCPTRRRSRRDAQVA